MPDAPRFRRGRPVEAANPPKVPISPQRPVGVASGGPHQAVASAHSPPFRRSWRFAHYRSVHPGLVELAGVMNNVNSVRWPKSCGAFGNRELVRAPSAALVCVPCLYAQRRRYSRVQSFGERGSNPGRDPRRSQKGDIPAHITPNFPLRAAEYRRASSFPSSPRGCLSARPVVAPSPAGSSTAGALCRDPLAWMHRLSSTGRF